jgi:chemotaxis family two-component system sensor kinase Cph1
MYISCLIQHWLALPRQHFCLTPDYIAIIMNNTDLTNCDREPIHIPGKIQSHGFLITIDNNFMIIGCSENINKFLSLTASNCLGEPISILDGYLGKAKSPSFIAQLIQLYTTSKGFEPSNPYPIEIGNLHYNLILCQLTAGYLLEFENELSDLDMNIHDNLGHSLSEILSDTDLYKLLENAAYEIKKIIGYDRVMVYQFHEDEHGEVIVDVKNEDLESLLNLHYPASDIPQQARVLYIKNLTRIIADVEAKTYDIIAAGSTKSLSFDLTHSSLRAVSPIHIQYLKNMGVASSFSISIIHKDKLWGLIACHNYSPRFINYKQRAASRLISQVLSSALSYKQMEMDQIRISHLQSAVETLSKQLRRNDTIDRALFEHDVKILHVTDSTGAVLFFDNQIYKCGQTPDDEFLKGLHTWLNEYIQQEVFSTNHLPLQNPQALPYKDCASGLLVCRLSKEMGEYLIWFKPERISTVTWAGDPEKPVHTDENGLTHISPRTSFTKWVQTIHCTSEPWKKEDIKSAMLLLDEVAFAIKRKATDIRILNERIKKAYDELDAFSYTISHDLKNPISSIKGYSQLLSRNGSLDDKAHHMVKRIEAGADKMKDMVGDVLHYSLIGKSVRNPVRIDMAKLLNETRDELLVASNSSALSIDIVNTIDLIGDATMVMQVFSNLLSNAVKYSKETPQPEVTIACEDTGEAIIYAIRDNGIGIEASDHDQIFELFRRSDKVQDYEGTGVGLSIVRRIMEKHNGKIWLESEPGAGSVFYVAFNKELPVLS